MIEIQDQKLFAKVIAEAMSHTETSDIPAYLKKRWHNAIGAATRDIEENGTFMEWQDDRLLIWSQESNEIYEANGTCSCKAYELDSPCRHRAAARLVRNYYAALDAVLLADLVEPGDDPAPGSICPKCRKGGINLSSVCDFCGEDSTPYLPPKKEKPVEIVGKIRI